MPNGQPTPEEWRADQRREDYRQGVVSRAVRELLAMPGGDTEGEHLRADAILCEALVSLGCREIVDAWERVGKWYA